MAFERTGALRVLLLVPARDEGGAERVAEDLVRTLAGRCAFTVVLPENPGMHACAARLSACARVVRMPLDSGVGLWASVPRVRQLARAADVAHLNSTHPASRLAAVIAVAAAGAAPLVSVEHSGTPPSAVVLPRWYSPLAGFVFRASRRRAASVVAVSIENAERLVRDYGIDAARVAVVHNGIDLRLTRVAAGARQARRRAMGIADDEAVVLMAARQAPNKGHRYLAAAAPEVLESLPRTRFVLAGPGGPDAALRADVRARGLEASFLDLGSLEHSVAIETIAAADLLVLPSLAEGFSIVLLEAMAAGTVVVATSVGGAREAIADAENGFLVPPADPVALAQAVIRALQLPAGRRSQIAARARARAASFSIEVAADKMFEVYSRAARR
jgi:glycosyltransferase involved in cell wall biosynthesis